MDIEETLAKYPKVNLIDRPTPLDFLPNLSRQLDVNIYIKRDDLTDLLLLHSGGMPALFAYHRQIGDYLMRSNP